VGYSLSTGVSNVKLELTSFWLIKVILVVDKGGSDWVYGDWSVWAYQESDAASTAGRSSGPFFVHSDVAHYAKSESAVPGVRLHPIKRAKKCICATIASVDRCDTFYVVATLEQAHQSGLNGL